MHGHLKKRTRAVAVTTAMVAGLLALVQGTPAAEAQANGCPSVGSNFADEGPFDVRTESDDVTTFFFPTELGSQGCERHPVIIWGNGTFTTPAIYEGMLRHWASHGFIVAAANTSNAGSGQEMLQGIETLASANQDPSSPFNGRVDLDNVGSSGHSQGAAGALRTADDPRVRTSFPIQGNGNPTNVESILFLSGETDPFAGTMRNAYNASSRPAAYAELAGAGHLVPLGDGGGFRGGSTAWARWQLMGDADAAGQFQGADCGLCSSPDWSVYEANDQLQQLDGGGPGSGDPGNGDPGTPPEEPEEPECSFLARIFGLCGSDSGNGSGEDCSFLARLLGRC